MVNSIHWIRGTRNKEKKKASVEAESGKLSKSWITSRLWASFEQKLIDQWMTKGNCADVFYAHLLIISSLSSLQPLCFWWRKKANEKKKTQENIPSAKWKKREKPKFTSYNINKTNNTLVCQSTVVYAIVAFFSPLLFFRNVFSCIDCRLFFSFATETTTRLHYTNEHCTLNIHRNLIFLTTTKKNSRSELPPE